LKVCDPGVLLKKTHTHHAQKHTRMQTCKHICATGHCLRSNWDKQRL